MGVLPQRKPAALAAKPDLSAWRAPQLCSCRTFARHVSLICASAGRFLSLSFKNVSLQSPWETSDSTELSPSDGAAENWCWSVVWVTLRSCVTLFYPMWNPFFFFLHVFCKWVNETCTSGISTPPSAWEKDPGMFHKTFLVTCLFHCNLMTLRVTPAHGGALDTVDKHQHRLAFIKPPPPFHKRRPHAQPVLLAPCCAGSSVWLH